MFLSLFGFRELWSPGMMIVCLFVLSIYLLITIKWRKDFKNSTPLSISEAFSFILALLFLYVVKGAPIQIMTYLIYTAYTIQTVILFVLVPFLVVRGIPNYLLAYIRSTPFVSTLLCSPIYLSVVWSILFVCRQIPIVFDYLRLHETAESIYTILLFTCSFIFMWSMKGKRFNLVWKPLLLIYIVMTLVASIVFFSPVDLYKTYTDGAMWMQAMALCVPADTLNQLSAFSGPSLFTNMTPKQDQQLGSKLIQVIQTIIFGIILIAMRWNQKSRTFSTSQHCDD